MLIISLVVGLLGGLLAGGRIINLADVRLRLVWLLFLGLVIRYATQFAIEAGVPFVDQLRLPLFFSGFVIALWANREQPGLPLAFVGILLNATAIVTNGGYMPVWEPSIVAAGLSPTELGTAFHRIVGTAAAGGIPPDFLSQAGPLGDLIPIPIPFLRNVASIGDLLLTAGLGFFLFAVTVRHPMEFEEAPRTVTEGDEPGLDPGRGTRLAEEEENDRREEAHAPQDGKARPHSPGMGTPHGGYGITFRCRAVSSS